MGMRGPKLVIALVLATMAATVGYSIHVSRRVAGAYGHRERARPARVHRIEKALDDVEAAMGRNDPRR